MPLDTSDSTNLTIQELIEQFSRGSLRQRRRLIKSIETRSNELLDLGPSLLDDFDREGDNWSVGWILQVCQKKESSFLFKMLANKQKGWFLAPSKKGIDYQPLQKALLDQDYEEADRLTSKFLRELAGQEAVDRGYVYFSEVELMEEVDLTTIDRLWNAYSQGRFSFSVQGRILDSLNGKYEKLWPRIGWKTNGVWTRYPTSFTWSLEAPEGHMPLINQLRGVRLFDALLNHPALLSRRQTKT